MDTIQLKNHLSQQMIGLHNSQQNLVQKSRKHIEARRKSQMAVVQSCCVYLFSFCLSSNNLLITTDVPIFLPAKTPGTAEMLCLFAEMSLEIRDTIRNHAGLQNTEG